MDFRVTGGDELAAVARRVIATADRGLAKEFRAGLNRAAQPAVAVARRGAVTRLPRQGGLGRTVAAGQFVAKVNVTARSGELVVTVAAGMDLPALDAGQFRHPVYGNRGTWVAQTIRPHWFTDTMEAEADNVIRPVVEAAFAMLDRL